MTQFNPALGMLFVAACFAGLMAGLLTWQRRATLHPELTRKLVHVGMGLVTLLFPWLFTSAWPVLGLTGGFVILLLLIKWHPGLKHGIGGVIGGVSRKSPGDLYFPVSVGVVFVLSGGDPLRYCVPILILTLADAVSALIGVFFGSLHYEAEEGHKSLEGSLAFFGVALLSTMVPLWTWSGTAILESLLLAGIIALITTLVEASAWRGLDNLFLPLAALAVLDANLSLPAPELGLRLIVLVVLCAAVAGWRKRTTLSDSTVLGAGLACYLFWVVGGWPWLVAPITVLLSYSFFSPDAIANTQRIHKHQALIGIAAPALGWLFLDPMLPHLDLLFPASIALAAQLSMIALARMIRARPSGGRSRRLAAATLASSLLLFVPYALMRQATFAGWVALITGVPAVIGASLLFCAVQPNLENCPNNAARWMRQAAIAGAVSLAGLLPADIQ